MRQGKAMPDDRDAVFAAMAGGKKPKSRSSKRDARRGPVACTDACPDPRCPCAWGCWIEAGEKARPVHQVLELTWDCPSDHGMPGQAAYRRQVLARMAGDWRNDPTIVRPMNGGPA